MIIYILKSSACLLLLFGFYKLFLEKEKIHVFNRIYLIGSLFFALYIPFHTIDIVQEISNNSSLEIIDGSTRVLTASSQTNWIGILLIGLYSFGFLFFSYRYIRHLIQLFTSIKNNPKIKEPNHIKVLINQNISPYSFFKYVFFSKQSYENQEISPSIVLHELVHVKQKHSLDILLIETFQVVFWFNPIFYWIKKEMKTNHEYLADTQVLRKGTNIATYQKTLLSFIHNPSNLLASNINYSLTKKRLKMMTKQSSKTQIIVRKLSLIPILIGMVFLFSTKNIVAKATHSYDSTVDQYLDKATPEQIAEYNALAKKYNQQPIEHRVIKLKDIERLEYLYSLMTDTQKKQAEPFPECPPPPPPAPNRTFSKPDNIPPPPALPPVPSEHMKELAKQNAVFYYNGKSINAKKAIELTESNLNIHIQVLEHNSKKPIVKLSTKPIVIED